MKKFWTTSWILFIAVIAVLAPTFFQKTIAYIKNGQLVEAFSSPTKSIPLSMSANPVKTIMETTDANRTDDSSPFWLNSGAFFYSQDNMAQTIQGDLPPYSHWRLLYASSNPKDTDDGYHPQNVFRLITKKTYGDSSQEVYVRITKDNLSESENRNESNGVFLMNRYENADNLYYTGIRVDGTAVIKEKVSGEYYTLTQGDLFPGGKYDRETNPSLLPKHVWIGLRSEVKTLDSKTVVIKLYTDTDNTGIWRETLVATDTPQKGAPPLPSEGSGGIRTDFMDAEFKDYKITPIRP